MAGKKGKDMTEGKWVKAKHGEIEEGNVVRVTTKEGPQTVITEGNVTNAIVNRDGSKVWTIENFENFYDHEFVPDADGDFATLERFVPPFTWPTKLGAVVTGKDEDGSYTIVLVKLAHDNNPDYHFWWSDEWGTVTAADLSGLEDLTVVSEGVTVKA